MAKDLANIIRVHEWRVDEKRRKLGDLLRLLSDLEAQAQRLEAELGREQKIAAASPNEAAYAYGGYALKVIERRETLAQSVSKAEREISEARESLREAYRELKKFEVVQENRERVQAQELARRETATLDEIGMQTHLRKNA